MRAPTFLIFAGDGINCENEMKLSFELSGANTRVMHINDIVTNLNIFSEIQGIALPGGFSFGDELGSGQIMALKIKYNLNEQLKKFIHSKKPVIGICNGFQILLKLGLLPHVMGEGISVALAPNISGKFINRWVNLKIKNKKSPWLKSAKEHIRLPIRHAEGRIILKDKQDTSENLFRNNQVAMVYSEDVNGSYENIAAICDDSGLILGMMPHPEAAIFKATSHYYEDDPLEYGDGISFFKDIVEYINES